MDLGTQASPAASGNTGLISGLLHSCMSKTTLAPEAKLSGKKKIENPNASEYQQLVLLLEKRVKQTESENQVLRAEQKRSVRRCKVQRTLINHLRQQVEEQAKQLAGSETKNFLPYVEAGQDPRISSGRIVSLKGALLRIGGVEVPAEPITESRNALNQYVEAIDLEELQPAVEIKDGQGFYAKLSHLNVELRTRVSRWFSDDVDNNTQTDISKL